MAIAEIVDIKKATFIGLQENHIICDVEWDKPSRHKQWVESEGKYKMITFHPMALGAKIKLDTNNLELLEKAKALNPKDEIYIKYHVPKSEHPDDLKAWTILDILDEIDLLELQINNKNKNVLFSMPGDEERIAKIFEDKRAEKAMKKSKKKISSKDKRIAELEQENAELKLQIQKLKKQLEN